MGLAERRNREPFHMIGTKSILARSLDVNEWEFTDEISVLALAGTAMLAACTMAAADDNGALTGAAGGAVAGAVVVWTDRGRSGWCGRRGYRRRNNGGPATCCCETCALCEQNYNDDQQQYGR